MEYCPGGDLSNIVEQRMNFSEKIIQIYAGEIILALGALHSACIIFRDLKPSNIVVDKDGHVLLTDFGLSKEGQ